MQLNAGKIMMYIVLLVYTVPFIIIGVMLRRRVSLKVESNFNMFVSEFQDSP